MIFEENLTTQAGLEAQVESSQGESPLIHGGGRSGGRARTMLAVGILCSPAVDLLRVIYLGR
jgi:hypothetical protein